MFIDRAHAWPSVIAYCSVAVNGERKRGGRCTPCPDRAAEVVTFRTLPGAKIKRQVCADCYNKIMAFARTTNLLSHAQPQMRPAQRIGVHVTSGQRSN